MSEYANSFNHSSFYTQSQNPVYNSVRLFARFCESYTEKGIQFKIFHISRTQLYLTKHFASNGKINPVQY
jgi:hypothetical protein